MLLTILRYNLDANQRTLLREHLIDRNYLYTILLIKFKISLLSNNLFLVFIKNIIEYIHGVLKN